MAQEMASAPDLRTFAEKARLRPEDGGIAYADAAATYCAAIRGIKERARDLESEVATDPKQGARRMELLSAMLRRCASFIPGELGGQAMQDAYKLGLQSDPIVRARSKLYEWSKLGEQQRKEVATEVLAMRDPILLQRLGTFVAVPKDGKLVTYLDGKEYGGIDPAEFQMALNLLPCAFGQPCDSTDPLVVEACVVEGNCLGDLWKLHAHFSRGSPLRFERIQATYHRLVAAVSSGDLSAFAPSTQQSLGVLPSPARTDRSDPKSSAVPPLGRGK